MVTRGRHVVTPAATHRPCLDLATSNCPYLRDGTEHRAVEVTRAMISSGGRPLTEVSRPVSWQDWTPSAVAA